MSKGIDLLKTKKQISISTSFREIFILRWIAVGLLFIVSVLSVVLFLLIALSPLPRLQKQRENDLRTLASLHPEMAKFYLIDERLKTSNVIINKRKNFDKVLSVIINNLPDQLNVSAFSLKDKSISVTVDSGSLSKINTFITNLVKLANNKKSFSNVGLTDLTVNQQQNSFTATVNLTVL